MTVSGVEVSVDVEERNILLLVLSFLVLLFTTVEVVEIKNLMFTSILSFSLGGLVVYFITQRKVRNLTGPMKIQNGLIYITNKGKDHKVCNLRRVRLVRIDGDTVVIDDSLRIRSSDPDATYMAIMKEVRKFT